MDLKRFTPDDYGGAWTEERHSAFLDWLEERFVRRVLARETDFEVAAAEWSHVRRLPLDRYLPDSATESTRDLRRADPPKGRPSVSHPASPPPEDPEQETVESAVTSWEMTRKPSPPSRSDAQVRDANELKDESVEVRRKSCDV